MTGTFDNWTKSVKLEKEGDVFQKSVELKDASAKIYYKVCGCPIYVDPICFCPMILRHRTRCSSTTSSFHGWTALCTRAPRELFRRPTGNYRKCNWCIHQQRVAMLDLRLHARRFPAVRPGGGASNGVTVCPCRLQAGFLRRTSGQISMTSLAQIRRSVCFRSRSCCPDDRACRPARTSDAMPVARGENWYAGPANAIVRW